MFFLYGATFQANYKTFLEFLSFILYTLFLALSYCGEPQEAEPKVIHVGEICLVYAIPGTFF
jgi:hypothetical protein